MALYRETYSLHLIFFCMWGLSLSNILIVLLRQRAQLPRVAVPHRHMLVHFSTSDDGLEEGGTTEISVISRYIYIYRPSDIQIVIYR